MNLPLTPSQLVQSSVALSLARMQPNLQGILGPEPQQNDGAGHRGPSTRREGLYLTLCPPAVLSGGLQQG